MSLYNKLRKNKGGTMVGTMKRITSLVLVLLLVLSSSLALAADFDLRIVETGEVRDFLDWPFDDEVYLDVVLGEEEGKYLIECEGKFYKAEEVVEASQKNPNAELSELVKDLEPVAEEPDELKVVSVSAINAKEIKVVFNQELDKTSAETVENYSFTTSGDAVVDAASIKLQEDKKTVIIPLSTELANGDTYKVDVQNVRSKDYKPVQDYTGTVTIFNDKEAPTVKKVELDASNNVIKVYFSEPVASFDAKVDSGTMAIGTYTYAVSTKGEYVGEFSIPIGEVAGATAKGSHTVTIYNATDLVGNKATILTASYTVAEDTVPPTVTKIEPVKGTIDSFKITFSEPVTLDTSTPANNLTVKKGTTVFDVVSLAADPVSNRTEYVATVDQTADTNNLYEAGEDTVTLNVTIKGYKDDAGLIGQTVTKTVTLNKDAVKPFVEGVIVDETTRTITLKFNEDLSTTAADIDDTKIVVKKDGIVLDAAEFSVDVDATNNDELVFTFTTLDPGTYTIQLKAGAVKDQYTPAPNTNKEITKTVVVKEQAQDKFYDFSAASGATITSADNKVTIDFKTKMGDSAINKANYLLDGKSLPARTEVYFLGSAQEKVVLDLTDVEFKTNTDMLLIISKNVKTNDGKIVVNNVTDKDEVQGIVSFVDNVKPVLESAKFDNVVDNKTTDIILTFSEPVTGTALTDFVVKVNDAEVSITSVAAGDKPNELRVTLTDDVNVTQIVEVLTVEEPQTIADNEGNKLVGNTRVRVQR